MRFDESDDGGEFDRGGSPILQLCQRPRVSLLATNHVEVVDDRVQMTNPTVHRLLNGMQDVGVTSRDLRYI